MAKYIDADRLREEITDLCTNANFYQQKAMGESNREDFVSSGGEIFAYEKVLSLINSLQQEQPGVELDENTMKKEFRMIDSACLLFNYDKLSRELLIARRFYLLGLKARKEE